MKAKTKNLPSLFWFIKTFLLGGIAMYELGITVGPPATAKDTESK